MGFFNRFVIKSISVFGYFLSHLVRQDDRLIVFGEQNGYGYSDNSKFLFEMFSELNLTNKKSKCYWVYKKKQKKFNESFNYVSYFSFKGQMVIAKSKFLITSHGLNDISSYVRQRKTHICLWHGLPFKRIGNKANNYKKEELKLFCFFPKKTNIDILYCNSQYFEGVFIDSFPDVKSVKLGISPRLYIGLKENAEHYLGASSKKILYAPTFRDNYNSKQYFEFVFPDENTLRRINRELIENDAVLFINYHPYIKVRINLEGYSNIEELSGTNINEFLPTCCALLTDYSGVFYDFLYYERPISFVMTDYETFNKDRGFYFGKHELPGNVYDSWADISVTKLMVTQHNHNFFRLLKMVNVQDFPYYKDLNVV